MTPASRLMRHPSSHEAQTPADPARAHDRVAPEYKRIIAETVLRRA
jgi:hypothetical protein